VEEVARIVGYDRIPATMLSSPLPKQNPEPILKLKKKIRQALAGYGFQEVVTYSLTSREVLEKAFTSPVLEPEPLRLANPMTQDQEYLRTSLRGSLLSALAANVRREEGVIKLFELGRVYLPRDRDLPAEPEFVCSLLAGSGQPKSWPGGEEPVDFFTIKGVVEGLLTQLGVTASFKAASDPGLRPGRQAAAFVGDSKIGVLGELHPRIDQAFDISCQVYLFELDLAALLPHTLGHKTFQPLPRFPAVARDIALVVDVSVTHRQIVDIIIGFPLVSQVALFDVYTGSQVPRGRKSLAYHIGFQSETHTLTDEEVDRVQQQILDRLSGELGASLRS
jgi:phenylalanyl-tRNA synthetase beta chain